MNMRPSIHALATTATFLALLCLAHLELGGSKGLPPSAFSKIVDFTEQTTPLLPRIAVPTTVREPMGGAAGAQSPLVAANGGMDHFYASLLAMEQEHDGRAVRIAHYGDSPTTADLITGDVREILQQRWGDAGHGFVLIAKPWAWYNHRNVEVGGSGWTIETAVGGHREGEYGYGGAAFDGSAGASSHIKLSSGGHTAVEVEYMASPTGGEVELSANGKTLKTISTRAVSRAENYATIAIPSESRTVDLRVTEGSVRLFGVTLNKGSSGVTYDSLGLNGATTLVLSRILNRKLWEAELQHRAPDLVVVNYGTNESSFGSFVGTQYEGELRLAIAKIREALPQTSILIMSPMDRGERSGGEIHTMATIPKIVEIQRKVAAETGCGFFNTYEAMGGDSTMERWYDGQPRLVAADLIHPTPHGARIVAETFANQLNAGYLRYKLKYLQQTEVGSAAKAKK